MNAEPTDPRHLDLEDLIAGAAGQPADDRTRAHLARCEQCRREAGRWDLVAGGVRGLGAGSAAASAAVPPARPARTRRRVLAGPGRRAVLAAGGVAAALLLLAGVGEVTGTVHVRFGSGGPGTVLTAVTGCSRLVQADGTLERVNGTSLVVRSAGGQPQTVTTTPATFVSMSGALLGDVTDGAPVTVHGLMAGETLDAAVITVGQPAGAVHPAGLVSVQGTVADAGPAGFTLVTAGGAGIPVATAGDTLVVIPHASLSRLRPGTAVFAVGRAGPGRTLAATGVAAVSQLPPGAQVRVSVKDCSPGSTEEALGAISAAPASAG